MKGARTPGRAPVPGHGDAVATRRRTPAGRGGRVTLGRDVHRCVGRRQGSLEHLRGRLTSVLQITFILNPLGSLFAGSMADVIGAPAIGAAMSLAAFALGVGILICSPRMRGLRLSTLQASQPSR